MSLETFYNMEGVIACRICLIMGVKMHDLKSGLMELYLDTISGTDPLILSELPRYVCYECGALLAKFSSFKEKCTKGQDVLNNILHTNGKITTESIQDIDRKLLNLTSNLSHQTIPLNNINFPLRSVVVNNGSVQADLVTDRTDETVKTEPDNESDSKFFMEIEDVKEEGDDFPSLGESSDDEPLCYQKSKKMKADQDSVDNSGLESQLLVKDTETETAIPGVAVKVKKKRGQVKNDQCKVKKPKKPRICKSSGETTNSIVLEEYVTVIKLTEEQQREEIVKRKESSNYQNAPFKCDLCFKGFIDTKAWNHHLQKHKASPGDFECTVCKFRFKTKRHLHKHASSHEKKFACKFCTYISKTTTQANQHFGWHKGVTYKCQYCNEVSTKWTSYLSHLRIKHPSQFICGVCGYSFVSKLGLVMHNTMMHKDVDQSAENVEGPYCEVCDVKFLSEEAWKRHMVTSVKHAPDDVNKGCRVCGESFATREEARAHHRAQHARARPRNYGRPPPARAWPAPCDHCSEEMGSAREYWAHFRRAHPDKNYPIQRNYVCDICGKSFRGNAFLTYHKRTHSEERLYKCEACPKAFHNRANLQLHERTHSDRRPYPCALCCKAFKAKGALDRHFRSHTGVKPYECEVCGKAFGQSNSRKLHIRTVHLKQPAPYVSKARLERRKATKDPTQCSMVYIS